MSLSRNRVAAVLCGALTLALLAGPARVRVQGNGSAAALPAAYVDTTLKQPTGRSTAVRAGGDLQAALNTAQPGDVISLEAGATFTGNFTLPRKSGQGWITVRSAAPDSSLPAPGTRLTPEQARVLPKLVTPNATPVISTAPGAHHYRFIGIEFTVAPTVKLIYSIVSFDGNQAVATDAPAYLIVDRCWVHGQPTTNAYRGVLLNSAQSAVIDSYVSDIHVVGFDSQAILGLNGPGPFKIVNNYLEAAGENIMFGGGDPKVKGLVPSDIEVRRNHLFKPLSWKAGHPSFAGTPWSVKNLFELKNARRVLVDGNLLENVWPHSQVGFAVLFTPRNQDGTAPWSVVEDVTFTNNRVRNVAGGVSMQGIDDGHPSQQLKRVVIQNNLFEGVARNFVVTGGPIDTLVISHNTAFPVGNAALVAQGKPSPSFVMTNNLLGFGAYGLLGNEGVPILQYFPGGRLEKNVLVGPGEGRNQQRFTLPGNYAEPALEAVRMVNPAAADYRLAPGSRFRRAATDGNDIGVDYEALATAMQGTGRSSPPASPTR